MGVLKLWVALEPTRHEIDLETLRGKKIAVDLSLWIFECSRQASLKGGTDDKGLEKLYFRNIFFRTLAMLKLGIKPIFVFDNITAPQCKAEAIGRRLQVDHLHTTNRTRLAENNKELFDLFDSLGVPFVVSSGEAEALCARLEKEGVIICNLLSYLNQ